MRPLRHALHEKGDLSLDQNRKLVEYGYACYIVLYADLMEDMRQDFLEQEEYDAQFDVETLTKRETRAFKKEKKKWMKDKKAYVKGMKKLEPIMQVFRSGMLLEMRKELAARHAALLQRSGMRQQSRCAKQFDVRDA